MIVGGENIKNVVFCYAVWQDIYQDMKDRGIVTKFVNKMPSVEDFTELTAEYQHKGGSLLVIDDFMQVWYFFFFSRIFYGKLYFFISGDQQRPGLHHYGAVSTLQHLHLPPLSKSFPLSPTRQTDFSQRQVHPLSQKPEGKSANICTSKTAVPKRLQVVN
jgi:hypothetical protein